MLKKITTIFFSLVLSIFVYFGLVLYTKQEALLFKSATLSQGYTFTCESPFHEIFIDTPDGGRINSLLFGSIEKPSDKLILYFHGRGDNLSADWDSVVTTFLNNDHDVLMMDYRSFGKSHGPLSEKALLSDADLIYDYAAHHYKAENIVIYGRSLGTGFATYTASKHSARLLILEAPYFSMLELAYMKFPFLPKSFFSFILKYHLKTNEWIKETKIPIEIFHGTHDTLIPIENSMRLQALSGKTIHLNILTNGTHNNLISHKDYQKIIKKLLKE